MIELSFDLLKKTVDWLNVVPLDCTFNDLIRSLELYDIDYSKKYQFNNYFIVIDKKCYSKFLDVFYHRLIRCRITRIDIKFDFTEDYNSFYNRVKSLIIPSSTLANHDIVNTCYFGNRNSGLFARFYNKTLESDLNDDISRLEYEIKGSIALQFSIRWLERGADDALNYLSKRLTEFNSVYGLGSVIGFFNFSDVEPFDVSYFDKNDIEHSLKHFLKQYSKSIIKYSKYLGDYETLYRLCLDYGR